MGWNRQTKGLQARYLVAGLGMALWLGCQPAAMAAESIVLRYRIFRATLPVEDLARFAETGETTRKLRRYLRWSNQDPEQVRQVLTQDVQISARTLDRILANPASNLFLDEISQFVHTRSRETDRASLRAALLRSAEEDDRINLIEVLQNYPTREIHVNGNRLVSTYRQLEALHSRVDGLLEGRFNEILRDLNLF